MKQNTTVQTRADVASAVVRMTDPLRHKFAEDGAGLALGVNTAHYADNVARMEGLLRTLWGIGPLVCGGDTFAWIDAVRRAIVTGTTPESAGYWGKVGPGDQKIVEMTSLSVSLLLAPEHFWQPLSQTEQKNLATWLAGCNDSPLASNNWVFFSLLANKALQKLGMPYSPERVTMAIDAVERCYIEDGWYSDGFSAGKHTAQRDYYIPFAMHYFSLLYAGLFEAEEPALCAKWKARSVLFAKDFAAWFDESGAALPFGRSLTYRFAQGCFWGALAFAGVEAMPWGVIKGLWLRNFRWWMEQDAFTAEGVLTVGYAYPNLKMTEFYNSPGSPYWAFKFFLPLALPENHPFWQAEELPLPQEATKTVTAQPHPYMLLCHEQDRPHLFALTGGQYAGFEPTFNAAKYEKFAYSTAFGFSVPAGEYGLDQGAFDSALALCENADSLYRVRRKCESVCVRSDLLFSRWKPWDDVTVETWLIPCTPWHVRIHRIRTERALSAAEGGFAIEQDDRLFDANEPLSQHVAFVKNDAGISLIADLLQARTPQIINTAPNTNVLYPRAKLPMLCTEITAGETWLACAVLGQPACNDKPYDVANMPSFRLEQGAAEIFYNGETKRYDLKECYNADGNMGGTND